MQWMDKLYVSVSEALVIQRITLSAADEADRERSMRTEKAWEYD